MAALWATLISNYKNLSYYLTKAFHEFIGRHLV